MFYVVNINSYFSQQNRRRFTALFLTESESYSLTAIYSIDDKISRLLTAQCLKICNLN